MRGFTVVSFRPLAVATHSATGAVVSLPGPWEMGRDDCN